MTKIFHQLNFEQIKEIAVIYLLNYDIQIEGLIENRQDLDENSLKLLIQLVEEDMEKLPKCVKYLFDTIKKIKQKDLGEELLSQVQNMISLLTENSQKIAYVDIYKFFQSETSVSLSTPSIQSLAKKKNVID